MKPVDALKHRFSSAKAIDEIVFRDGKWEVHATFSSRSDRCPSCNSLVSRHGWSQSRFIDTPLDGKIVHLFIKRPRFICRSCSKTLTPVVPGVVESPRVTERLVSHVRFLLWTATSLRNLASSVGALPKTISELLKRIAEEARETTSTPTELGIHVLTLHENRHLVLSNLSVGTVVDFLPSVDEQIELLIQRLIAFNKDKATQVVSVPADQEIVNVATSHCSVARIELSLSAIHTLIAGVVSKLGAQESRRGRSGSVSRGEVERLSYLRKSELSDKDVECLSDGIQEGNSFWKLFDAKELLMSRWEMAECSAWVDLFRIWLLGLPSSYQPAFHGLLLLLSKAEQLQVTLSLEPTLPFIDRNISSLKELLLKPGRSFSPEMLVALVLASPFMTVRLERKVSIKGAGRMWLEESWDIGDQRPPSSAGISLENLVNLLSSVWNPHTPDTDRK
ncbi:hypothetical protein MTYP_02820 [Methylophilaceae bacterium]|nr:hypothetical protein MTYP_02820 [Methylophilaceae bacterium]